MKKKLILGSALGIVMCSSLIAGATMALFTSESKVNIAVTSGKVDVVARIQDDSVQTKQLNSEYVVGEGNTYAGGVTVTEETGEVNLDRIVPGDGVKFAIDIVNNSNVTVKYRTKVTCETGYDLYGALDITFDGGQSNWTTLEEKGSVATINVEIVMPEDVGNEYQFKDAKLAFTVEAVQGNAETVDEVMEQNKGESVGTVDVPADNVDDVSVTTENGLASVVVPAESVSVGAESVSLSVAPLSSDEADAFNLENEAVYYNITADGVTLDQQDLNLCVYIGKDLASVAIYHSDSQTTIKPESYNPDTGYVSFSTRSLGAFAFTGVNGKYLKVEATDDAAANGKALLDAINSALDGATIEVAAGEFDLPKYTYDSPVNGGLSYGLKIDKSVTLKGAFAGVAATDSSRNSQAETVITSSLNDYNSGAILFAKYDVDVTIDGFTFDSSAWDTIGCDDPGVRHVNIVNNIFNMGAGDSKTPIKLKLESGNISDNKFIGTNSGYGIRIIGIDKREVSWNNGANGAKPDSFNIDIKIQNNDFTAFKINEGNSSSRGVVHISTGDEGTVALEGNNFTDISKYAIKNNESKARITSNNDISVSAENVLGEVYFLNIGVAATGTPLENGKALVKAIETAAEGATINVGEGEYDVTATSTDGASGGIAISTPNITLKGESGAIIYAKTNGGNWSYSGVYQQNTLTVTADNITLDGLTFRPIEMLNNGNGIAPKALEVTNAATHFTLKNCIFEAMEMSNSLTVGNGNTQVEEFGKYYGGQVSINTSKDSNKSTILIENNTFNYAVLDFRTAATIKGNTFNSGSGAYHAAAIRFRAQYDGSTGNNQNYDDITFVDNKFENFEEQIQLNKDPYVVIVSKTILTLDLTDLGLFETPQNLGQKDGEWAIVDSDVWYSAYALKTNA